MKIFFLNVTHPAKEYGHLNVTRWIGSDGKTYMNSSAAVFEDLAQEIYIVSVFRPSSPSDNVYEHLFWKSTVNVCKLKQGIISNPFVRAVLDGILKDNDISEGNNAKQTKKILCCF